ncbi:MAG: chromate transporter [Rhodovarius sp.]|nr:chromate transporter [Rhodovarius sp.]
MKPGAAALFLAYLQVGLSGFGGANAWARRMLVEKRGWLTDAEYAERLGLGQALPGPNAMNTAIIVGYGFAGLPGALAAVAGLFLGPLVILAALAGLYDQYGTHPPVRGALAGVAAGAAGMMLGTAIKMARRSRPSAAMWGVGALVLALALFRVPIGAVVVACAPAGILAAWWEWRSRAG